MSQNWPPRSCYADEEKAEGDPDHAGGGDGGGTGQAGGGAGAGDPNMEATRLAIATICDCTAVSAELAAYALQFSQVFFASTSRCFGGVVVGVVFTGCWPFGRCVCVCVWWGNQKRMQRLPLTGFMSGPFFFFLQNIPPLLLSPNTFV